MLLGKRKNDPLHLSWLRGVCSCLCLIDSSKHRQSNKRSCKQQGHVIRNYLKAQWQRIRKKTETCKYPCYHHANDTIMHLLDLTWWLQEQKAKTSRKMLSANLKWPWCCSLQY